MNFIAAFLLLRMDEEGAFWTMVKLLGEDRYMAGYYQADMVECQVDQMILGDLVRSILPKLYKHLEDLDIAFNTLSMRWFLCLFISVLPSETTMRFVASLASSVIAALGTGLNPHPNPIGRIWDIFLREGRIFLFQVSVAILKLHEKVLTTE